MRFRSVFDIIGPVMVGPSSSHTAGATRIGLLARTLFGQEADRADIHFFGSFARTYKGHATDVAVVAGLLGLAPSDPRIPDSLILAEEAGMKVYFHEEVALPQHPNTVEIVLSRGKDSQKVKGISLGGGLVQIVQINGFDLRLSGEAPALLIFHIDAYGTIAAVTQLLALAQVNISHMEVSRAQRGREALMVIETDQPVLPELIKLMVSQPHINKIVTLDV